MVGNVALDVVIGLVFVYLLYSLYTTVIMEIIASTFGLRARNLSYTIARMLMDEKEYKKGIKRGISQMMTSLIQISGKSINLKNPELYNKFFEQPSIKYLSSGGVNSKPSYLTPETFSKALIDTIKVDDPEVSVLACIEAGLLQLPDDSETKKQIQSLLDDANFDLVRFRLLVERWYTDTMERATGWYKRSVQIVLLFIGFFLAVAYNVDTVAIIKRLSTDRDAREQLVKMAIDFNEKHAADTLNNQPVDASNEQLNYYKRVEESLQTDIQHSQDILSADWNIPTTVKFEPTPISGISNDYKSVPYRLPAGNAGYIVVHKTLDEEILKKVMSSAGERGLLKVNALQYKLRYIFTAEHFGGYLLTVLALSLGAPFWFDLLNKLVKLRTSKSVSTEGGDKGDNRNSSSANTSILNRVG